MAAGEIGIGSGSGRNKLSRTHYLSPKSIAAADFEGSSSCYGFNKNDDDDDDDEDDSNDDTGIDTPFRSNSSSSQSLHNGSAMDNTHVSHIDSTVIPMFYHDAQLSFQQSFQQFQQHHHQQQQCHPHATTMPQPFNLIAGSYHLTPLCTLLKIIYTLQ